MWVERIFFKENCAANLVLRPIIHFWPSWNWISAFRNLNTSSEPAHHVTARHASANIRFAAVLSSDFASLLVFAKCRRLMIVSPATQWACSTRRILSIMQQPNQAKATRRPLTEPLEIPGEASGHRAMCSPDSEAIRWNFKGGGVGPTLTLDDEDAVSSIGLYEWNVLLLTFLRKMTFWVNGRRTYNRKVDSLFTKT